MKATTTSRLPWDAPGADCDSKPSIFQGSEVFRCFESVQQSSGESEALCRRCHSVDLCCAALCAHRGACDPCFPLKDISQLRLSLMLNSAMCHLKQSDPARCVEVPCSGCCWRCLWRVKSCDTLSLRYAKKHSKSTAIASRLSFSQSSVRLLSGLHALGAGRRFSGAGLARVDLGQLAEGVADIKPEPQKICVFLWKQPALHENVEVRSELSPDDTGSA